MDGDLDLVVGVTARADRRAAEQRRRHVAARCVLCRRRGARAFAWADLDGDADPDAAFLDARRRRCTCSPTGRPGRSRPSAGSDGPAPSAAITVADLDADGAFDLVALDAGTASCGSDRARTRTGGRPGARRGGTTAGALDGAASRVVAADLDNNGALDLSRLRSPAGRASGWRWRRRLRSARRRASTATVSHALDLNGDGTLDLVGVGGRARRRGGWAKGSRGYHWQVIRPRAQQNAGDQRINSFGVGGEIEVRAGLLLQKQLITGAGRPLRAGHAHGDRRRAHRLAQRRAAGRVRCRRSTTRSWRSSG